jgi:ATP-binding cassette subfamily B protein
LDDATSALDMETEQLIQQKLREVGRTTKIIIGHRISAVRAADEIIVLDDHTIAERGTHKELMAKKGRYYQTWCVQYGEAGENGGNKNADHKKTGENIGNGGAGACQ